MSDFNSVKIDLLAAWQMSSDHYVVRKGTGDRVPTVTRKDREGGFYDVFCFQGVEVSRIEVEFFLRDGKQFIPPVR
jgi:hypothetical protein